MAVAQFDYAAWAAMFPELAGSVTSPIAASYFTIAQLLVDNTDCSPVADVNARLIMLDYVVAHLASLSGYPLQPGQTVPQPRDLVGRTSSATEGTVSVSTDYGAMRENSAWWMQTQYGAIFWQLTRQFRTMHYVAPMPRYFGPLYGLPRR